MINFDLDNLKKTWQEQHISKRYTKNDIDNAISKKSRNYVKYILWISLTEFFLVVSINSYHFFNHSENITFAMIFNKMGIYISNKNNVNFQYFYISWKIVNIIVIALFVISFYLNYRRINLELNLKKLILQIIKFKKIIKYFIWTNIVLLFLYLTIDTYFVFIMLDYQNMLENQNKIIYLFIGLFITILLCIGTVLFYYKLVYGSVMNKLENNLKQLQEIDK